MVDQKLVSFVRKALKEGISLKVIKSQLKEKGWPDKEINDTIQSVIPSEIPSPKTYCWNCGTENDTTAKACKNCGVNLEEIPKEKRNKRIFQKVSFSKKKFLIFIAIALVIISAFFMFKFGWLGGTDIPSKEAPVQPAEISASCSGVVLDIKSVCKSGSSYNIKILNNGMQDVKKFKILLKNGNEETVETSQGIRRFGAETITVTPTSVTEVKGVVVLPIIQAGESEMSCGSATESFTEGEPYSGGVTAPPIGEC